MTETDTREITPDQYGVGDASYRAVGGLEGITRLVERFYYLMDNKAHAQTIRKMHEADLTKSKEKLVAFLSGWLGGPPLYSERHGGINLPMAHRHLPIDEAGAQSWLDCMSQAIKDLGYSPELHDYMMRCFTIPARGIQLMSEHKAKTPPDPDLFYEVK